MFFYRRTQFLHKQPNTTISNNNETVILDSLAKYVHFHYFPVDGTRYDVYYENKMINKNIILTTRNLDEKKSSSNHQLISAEGINEESDNDEYSKDQNDSSSLMTNNYTAYTYKTQKNSFLTLKHGSKTIDTNVVGSIHGIMASLSSIFIHHLAEGN